MVTPPAARRFLRVVAPTGLGLPPSRGRAGRPNRYLRPLDTEPVNAYLTRSKRLPLLGEESPARQALALRTGCRQSTRRQDAKDHDAMRGPRRPYRCLASSWCRRARDERCVPCARAEDPEQREVRCTPWGAASAAWPPRIPAFGPSLPHGQ